MTALVRAELIKLTTVRSPRWMLLAELVLLVLAASGAIVSGGIAVSRLATPDGQRMLLVHGGVVAVLSLCVGITVSAGEFRHGTVVDTYLGEPRRERVVAAQLAAGAVAGLVAGVSVAAVAVGLDAVWCAVENVPLDATACWRSAVGVILWQVLYTVLGVAAGALVRAPAGAVVAAVAWLYVVETAVAGLVAQLGKWLPATAARALGGDPTPGLLGQAGAGLVLAGWTVAVGLAAVAVTRRRDLA